jgi:hypothetical protein
MGFLERWREWRESSRENEAVEAEMRFHVEQETARNIRHGLDPAQARREALKAFGGIDHYRERARDERTGSAFADLGADVRCARCGARRRSRLSPCSRSRWASARTAAYSAF